MREVIRYWELRRVIYNLVLMMIFVGWVLFGWQRFRPALNLENSAALVVLALIANLCYSAAYLADFFLRHLLRSSSWPAWRIGVFVAGTLFAIVLENYWIADEIYPSLH